MSAEQVIYAALSSAAGVTALVASRIYPDQAAQNAPLPLIVFERTSTDITATIHDGAPVASKVTVSTSAWAHTRLEAEQIADAMQIALRTIGVSTDRFSHFDAEVQAYAAVVAFDVWEL